jgi:Mn-containing catalase
VGGLISRESISQSREQPITSAGGQTMFSHDKHLQYKAEPDKPDAIYAKKLQEVLGGQWGEITVSLQYLFQGWNCRGPRKYRDMLLDIGTEEIAHVEMLATMIARLLEKAPVAAQEEAVRDPAVMAVMGGMNPQHMIVTGLGANIADSVGVPWNGRYVTASGNLLADFRYNLTAETMGRLQVCRLYEQTTDSGVRDMLSFLIARDTMHQNQWLAAIAELEAEGLDETPAPNSFPQSLEMGKVAYQFWNCSTGGESKEGRWASGPSPDGKGKFEFLEHPKPLGPEPALGVVDPRTWGTPPKPVKVSKRKAS